MLQIAARRHANNRKFKKYHEAGMVELK